MTKTIHETPEFLPCFFFTNNWKLVNLIPESYVILLNVKPSNLVFLKTYNTEFDDTIITFTDKNNIPLEIEDKVNLTLFINK